MMTFPAGTQDQLPPRLDCLVGHPDGTSTAIPCSSRSLTAPLTVFSPRPPQAQPELGYWKSGCGYGLVSEPAEPGIGRRCIGPAPGIGNNPAPASFGSTRETPHVG